jgi:hypothetical protein
MLILFCMRGCGRAQRPAFPAPSVFREREVDGKTRANLCCEIAKLCHDVIAKSDSDDRVRRSSTSEGGSNPYLLAEPWIASLANARNDEDGLFEKLNPGCHHPRRRVIQDSRDIRD